MTSEGNYPSDPYSGPHGYPPEGDDYGQPYQHEAPRAYAAADRPRDGEQQPYPGEHGQAGPSAARAAISVPGLRAEPPAEGPAAMSPAQGGQVYGRPGPTTYGRPMQPQMDDRDEPPAPSAYPTREQPPQAYGQPREPGMYGQAARLTSDPQNVDDRHASPSDYPSAAGPADPAARGGRAAVPGQRPFAPWAHDAPQAQRADRAPAAQADVHPHADERSAPWADEPAAPVAGRPAQWPDDEPASRADVPAAPWGGEPQVPWGDQPPTPWSDEAPRPQRLPGVYGQAAPGPQPLYGGAPNGFGPRDDEGSPSAAEFDRQDARNLPSRNAPGFGPRDMSGFGAFDERREAPGMREDPDLREDRSMRDDRGIRENPGMNGYDRGYGAPDFDRPDEADFNQPEAADFNPPAAAFNRPPAPGFDRAPAPGFDRPSATHFDRPPAPEQDYHRPPAPEQDYNGPAAGGQGFGQPPHNQPPGAASDHADFDRPDAYQSDFTGSRADFAGPELNGHGRGFAGPRDFDANDPYDPAGAPGFGEANGFGRAGVDAPPPAASRGVASPPGSGRAQVPGTPAGVPNPPQFGAHPGDPRQPGNQDDAGDSYPPGNGTEPEQHGFGDGSGLPGRPFHPGNGDYPGAAGSPVQPAGANGVAPRSGGVVYGAPRGEPRPESQDAGNDGFGPPSAASGRASIGDAPPPRPPHPGADPAGPTQFGRAMPPRSEPNVPEQAADRQFGAAPMPPPGPQSAAGGNPATTAFPSSPPFGGGPGRGFAPVPGMNGAGPASPVSPVSPGQPYQPIRPGQRPSGTVFGGPDRGPGDGGFGGRGPGAGGDGDRFGHGIDDTDSVRIPSQPTGLLDDAENPRRVRGRTVGIVAIIVVVIGLLAGALYYTSRPNAPTYQIGACVQHSGDKVVGASCSMSGAFKIVSKVTDPSACPDTKNPYVSVDKTVYCLAPVQ